MRRIEARGYRGTLRAAMLLLVCAVLLDGANRVANAQTPFGFPDVVEKARALSRRAFTPPATIPEFWQRVGYDQYRDIVFDLAQALWGEGRTFRVELIHPG